MINSVEIEQSKSKFLDKYNRMHSVDKALTKSINAALGRNPLYNEKAKTNDIRRNIKKIWMIHLNEMSKKYYVQSVNREVFIQDVIELKEIMNDSYGMYFSTEFRISHSQKSLSVFLKHLWCMNMIERPPICPLDRKILEAAGRKYSEAKWTHINDIEEYAKKISWLQKEAFKINCSLAEWELLVFK
ncbi:hypothetical protein [Anoxynatronum buryatiense]|uniref:Uncharacterized protein n=1 Tax=Anoxynatronum buryatiense TaxID=489973 RepID=A0AA46AKK6_9CLOT|nr:hypothetical protein [Anoxynatronum buryatiense]SMP71991.1 hypothetical protein SAMN06296020_1252 [Anoxynatronum buryatiense]